MAECGVWRRFCKPTTSGHLSRGYAICFRSQRCLGVPNAIGEQPIQIGKVWIAVDEEVQAFAIVLARPYTLWHLAISKVR